ncbi:MAG: hypothetical protein KKH88_04375 [Nanoarchaeota archaeon]|nr:hypothetical protein [Nanoarchaeota archaeon]
MAKKYPEKVTVNFLLWPEEGDCPVFPEAFIGLDSRGVFSRLEERLFASGAQIVILEDHKTSYELKQTNAYVVNDDRKGDIPSKDLMYERQ